MSENTILPANFLIIPGAMQPASSFNKFIERLKADNHHAEAFDLPIDDPDANVDIFKETVNKRIQELKKTGRLIAVAANSRGGHTLVRVDGDIHIHINTFVPLAIDQKDLMATAPPAHGPGYLESIVKLPPDGRLTIIENFEKARKFFYPNLTLEEAEYEYSCLRKQNRSDGGEAIPTQSSIPNIVIASEDDAVILPSYTVWMARTLLGVEPYIIPGGHFPHQEDPDALAQTVYKGIRDLKLA